VRHNLSQLSAARFHCPESGLSPAACGAHGPTGGTDRDPKARTGWSLSAWLSRNAAFSTPLLVPRLADPPSNASEDALTTLAQFEDEIARAMSGCARSREFAAL